MERLTIDEIIAHCKRRVRREEALNDRDFFETELMGHYHMQEYWEHRQVAEYLEELKQYRAIGTVSEFRELKEKAIKKVEKYKDKYYCECGCPVEIMLDGITLKPIGGQVYCDQCGAKLDWSEFVEAAEAEKGE